MWDFSVGRTLAVVARSWPYVLLRIVVYSAITFAYVIGTGAGAGVGYGVGHIGGSGDAPAAFALWGGIVGFGLVGLIVYGIREYILYLVKAAHVAVMVRLLAGGEFPAGTGQVGYGRDVVSERFLQANALFLLDQLVKGVVSAIGGLLAGMSMLLPGLQGPLAFVHRVVRMSLTYVDEVILGYCIANPGPSAWQASQDGLVLYAQNARIIAKNAFWLTLMSWLLTLAVFALALSPAAELLYAAPGQLAGWSIVLAIIVAWAVRAAILEPFCIAALLQVYFRAIEGQAPDPEWSERLAGASRPFRELGERAAAAVRGPASA